MQLYKQNPLEKFLNFTIYQRVYIGFKLVLAIALEKQLLVHWGQ